MEDKKTKEAVASAVAEHKRLVVGDEQIRQETAMREIQTVLKKYEVALVPRAMLSPNGIEFMIETACVPPEALKKKKAKKAKQKAERKKGKRKK
jgi:hypothetical protein